MTQNQPSPQEEYRQSFLRHMVNRMESVEQRLRRFRRDGWDQAALAQMHDDVQRLSGTAALYELDIPSQRLNLLDQTVGDLLALKRLPDAAQSERMVTLLGMVNKSLDAMPEYQRLKARMEAAAQQPAVSAASPSSGNSDASSVVNARTDAARSGAFGWQTSRRAYIYGDGGDFASGIAQRLAGEGFEVESVDNTSDLTDLLMCVAPELLVVDASRFADLAAVGAARRHILERSPDERVALVAMAPHDNLQARLEARRAGVDTLLFPPFHLPVVVRKLQAQAASPTEDAVRVLIVEDDRSQALFAQSVLANAGMQVHVELDALHLLEALDNTRPDLILMDLHMPDASGVELTALIREHAEYMDTPIVFLTGENDPDARAEAINAGGDDFLSKPIRPKALVAAVQGRVRRRRAVDKRNRLLGARDQTTGLYKRAWLFDRANDAIGVASDQRSRLGGVMFLEIDGAAAIRERFGLAALEHLLTAAGRLLAEAVEESHIAAVISDNAFVVLATELDDAGLMALAGQLREKLSSHFFEEEGKTVRLVASVGVCPMRHGFGDASALINAAERACRDARLSEQGVVSYSPPGAEDTNPDASLARHIREAIAGDGFALVYQPIAAMQGGHTAQYQTLLRLREPSGKLVPAARILPLADRAGLMIDIDRWVLSRAIKGIARKSENGLPVRLFVPQALTSFAAKDQDAYLKDELAAHHVPGELLVLECGLADALLNPPALRAFMRSVGADGVQLCIGQFELNDDALRLFDQLQFGFIKLAPKYADDHVLQPLRDELRVLTDRAHRFGIQVIGHRVEDPQTAATLWLHGIDFIQGNFVQNPADELNFNFEAAVV